METSSDFEQASQSSFKNSATARRLSNAAQNFQKGRFASSIPPNYTEHLTSLYFETNVSQSPKILDVISLHDLPSLEKIETLASEVASLARDDVAQCGIWLAAAPLMADEVPFREILDCDGYV